ncbi:hypothetical protein Efla_004200 [Eimeria flavescens]
MRQLRDPAETAVKLLFCAMRQLRDPAVDVHFAVTLSRAYIRLFSFSARGTFSSAHDTLAVKRSAMCSWGLLRVSDVALTRPIVLLREPVLDFECSKEPV